MAQISALIGWLSHRRTAPDFISPLGELSIPGRFNIGISIGLGIVEGIEQKVGQFGPLLLRPSSKLCFQVFHSEGHSSDSTPGFNAGSRQVEHCV
jgi:hypothetical protein